LPFISQSGGDFGFSALCSKGKQSVHLHCFRFISRLPDQIRFRSQEGDFMYTTKQRELGNLTSLEKEKLDIALGVLRSASEYAEFLSWWLQEYGKKILSPNPPSPLMPDEPNEELPSIVDARVYMN
jgi:hypothetical protein